MDADVVWNSYDQPANLTPHHIVIPAFSRNQVRSDSIPQGVIFCKEKIRLG